MVVPDDHGTVQAAVDAAAPGDTVCVRDGTYPEQVVVDTSLELTSARGASPTIGPPADPESYTIAESGPTWEPVMFAYGGAEQDGAVTGSGTVYVTVSGVTVDGGDRQLAARRGVGLLLRNVRGAVTETTVENMAIGGNETMGILAYGDSDVRIADNVVDGYERGGIGANGDGGAHPSPSVTIANNDLTGSTGGGWAPNGIQVGYGATGTVRGNVLADHRWEGTAWNASGILVFESDGVHVLDNHVSNSDRAIGTGAWGWFADSTDGTRVVGNTVAEADIGITVEAVALGGYTSTNPSASNAKIVRNDLDGTGGDVGIQIVADDADDDYDPVATNNKVINNDVDEFATRIDDDGIHTKLAANEP